MADFWMISMNFSNITILIFIWVGSLGICSEVEGEGRTCLKLNFLMPSFFSKKLAFSGKDSTFAQSVRAVLQIFSTVFPR